MSLIPGKAELESSAGGGHSAQSSWGSAPSGWGDANGNGYGDGGQYVNAAELPADGSRMNGNGAVGGGVTAGGRYVPYRPPEGQQMQQTQPLPGIAELPTVKTPPE